MAEDRGREVWEDYPRDLRASSLPNPVKPTRLERRKEKKDKANGVGQTCS